MNFLSCMFDIIGVWFSDAAWFQAVKWPFWFFLILIAFGGVYSACFQKNTLLCRGITGALKLAIIYMFCIGVHTLFPSCMEFVPGLPFITYSDEALTLIHPKSLFSHPFTVLPQSLLKLYCLLFLINLGAHLDYGGRNKLPWLGSQIFTCASSMFVYRCVALGFGHVAGKFPGIINIFYISVFILFLLPVAILMTMKWIFIVFRKAGNPIYAKVMQFLSSQHFGSLYFVTFFSVLATLVFLITAHIWDIAEMTLANFTPFAYVLIMIMCAGTLLVFSMYYTERKFS